MPQCKAFGCFNERSKIKKSFFNFPRPDCSVQARNTCQAWLLNLKNASLPRKIDDYVWKRADLVCEDHFAPDSFDRINGTFASELAKSLNYRQKKRLKPDAVPTIVNTSCVDKTTGLAVRRRQRPLSEAASVSATAVCRRVKRKVLIKAKVRKSAVSHTVTVCSCKRRLPFLFCFVSYQCSVFIIKILFFVCYVS